VNIWWDQDSRERYWLEITDRDDLGADLWAPKVDDAGRPYWSYNLVTEVREGDVVLHWHKSLMGAPAMVGWSIASGAPEESTIIWQARGTVGRQAAPTGEEPAWRMALSDYTPLLEPVDQDALRREEGQLRKVHDRLTADHKGALYFPFAFSEKRAVRTAQGYLVKFPAALTDIFDELASIPRPSGATRPSRTPPVPGQRKGDAGYQSDPRVRRAIELHALELAVTYFSGLGYEVDNVGAFQSFDLLVTNGQESRHVEVKGSSGSAITVELTYGEVCNAESYQPTDLFIVDSVQWWREADGSITTDGGTERVLHDWKPSRDRLAPTRYRYEVPPDW